jgi:alpha-tubulin suppressor-like RCC1 family protein
MPKDDINYKFTENGIVYDFYDVFVPAENFRQPSLFTWGQNDNFAQLGINNNTNRGTPVTTFAGGTNWKQVACGSNHAVAAIKTDGTLWTWGRAQLGQLGNFAVTTRSTPVTTFTGGNNWKQVSIGYAHMAAIKTDGSLWTWGFGGYGQLGNFATTNRSTPVTIFAGGNDWKQVVCGGQSTSAIKTDGSLWTWGRNDGGQLGINQGNVNRSTPVTTFAGGNNWKQIQEIGMAIKTDGSLWTWGFGGSGRLGNNDTTNRSTPVTTFAGGNTWKQVSANGYHTAAIKTDGSLWIWGNAGSGRLGTNDTTPNRSTPVTTFAGGTNWKQVACGENQTLAIKTDGSLWAWGLNDAGQLGTNGGTVAVPVTTFGGGNNWKQVSSGLRHSAAIKYSPDP